MSGFKKVLLGCSVVFFLVAIAISVIVGMNWDKISDTFAEAKTAVGDVLTIQKEVAKEYGSATHIHMQNDNGTKSLGITVKNYTPPQGTGLEAEARKIATFAAGIPSVPKMADVVIINFEQSSDVKVITYSKTASYSFPIAELLAPNASADEMAEPAQ